MLKKLTATALTLLLLAMPTQAWNNKGHATVAYIAYKTLNPAVKEKVDKLLESHPDFQRLTAFAGPSTSSNYRLVIFMNAATWPDSIRDDPRFYDETDPEAVPTPKLPGFPSMKKFKPFHYIDLPYPAEDHIAVTGPRRINALKTLVAFRSAVNKSDVPPNIRAYELAWLLHIAGDVHQPLHCISRFTKELSPPEFPDGDRGGNEFKIKLFPIPRPITARITYTASGMVFLA